MKRFGLTMCHSRRLPYFSSVALWTALLILACISCARPIAYSVNQKLEAYALTAPQEVYWSAERPVFAVFLSTGKLDVQWAPALNQNDLAPNEVVTTVRSWSRYDTRVADEISFDFAGLAYRTKSVDRNPHFDAFTVSAITIPMWLPLLLWAIPLAAVPYCQRHAARIGLCPKCGYDLRATPNRCPECGTPIAKNSL